VQTTLLSKLKLDNSALHADHGGVSSVVGAQFGKDVPDLALDGLFADGELRGNLFVGIPLGDQTQDAHLCRGQRIFGGMLRKLKRHLRGDGLSPGMHGPNRIQQFLMQ